MVRTLGRHSGLVGACQSLSRGMSARSASSVERWYAAGPSRESPGQNGENPDQPAPRHLGVAHDEQFVGQGNAWGFSVCPAGLRADAEDGPLGAGQDDKTGIDVGAGDGEL